MKRVPVKENPSDGGEEGGGADTPIRSKAKLVRGNRLTKSKSCRPKEGGIGADLRPAVAVDVGPVPNDQSGEMAKPQRKRKEGQRGEMTRMTTLSSVPFGLMRPRHRRHSPFRPEKLIRARARKIDLQTKRREKCWPLIKWANRKEKEFRRIFLKKGPTTRGESHHPAQTGRS